MRQSCVENSRLSVVQTVVCGVPQGLVVGPLLCVLCTAELSEVTMRSSVADDTQLYLSELSDDTSVAVEHLDACLVDVKARLRVSRLRLNSTMTQVMWLGSGQ